MRFCIFVYMLWGNVYDFSVLHAHFPKVIKIKQK